eukprot:PITA_04188
MKLGFTRSEGDLNLYVKVENDKALILVMYVDDLFLTGADPLTLKCKRELASELEMKDLGLMHYFLGLEVWQKPGEIFLSQGKYVVKILERFGMMDCKPMTTSRILTFRSYMVVMSDQIWEMPLSFINSFALMFLVNLRSNICFAVSIVVWWTCKSTSGCCFTLGSTSISGMSKKQKLVALSTVEAEYIAASMASYEAI